MATRAKARPSHSQDPGATSASPTWMEGPDTWIFCCFPWAIGRKLGWTWNNIQIACHCHTQQLYPLCHGVDLDQPLHFFRWACRTSFSTRHDSAPFCPRSLSRTDFIPCASKETERQKDIIDAVFSWHKFSALTVPHYSAFPCPWDIAELLVIKGSGVCFVFSCVI